MFPLYIAAICRILSTGFWSAFFFLIIAGRAQKVKQAPQNPSLCIIFKAPNIIFKPVTKHTSLLIVAQLKQRFQSTEEFTTQSFAYISHHANLLQPKN